MHQLKDLAYYRTGGECQTLHEPESAAELAAIMTRIHAEKTPYFVLGGGTNSLVLDEYFPGAVIVFTRMKAVRVEGNTIVAQAGAENTEVAHAALDHSLAGVSWMNRLPGQVGATVRMNARCYGGEMSQVVTRVTAVLPTGEIKTYTPADGIFKGYKDTLFMDNGAIITEAALTLQPGNASDIKKHMLFCEEDRIKKGQFQYPTCGCVFKNDYKVGVPSGMLLDRAEARMLNQSKVALNPHHSNFVYNKGAGSGDILEFTFAMQDLVYREFGVWMEYEMEILGALPSALQKRVKELRPQRIDEKRIEPLRAEFQKNSMRMRPET